MLHPKPLSFPLWVEAAIVVVLLVMTVVEYVHQEWGWAGIFGCSGIFFGVGVIFRFTSGDKNGEA